MSDEILKFNKDKIAKEKASQEKEFLKEQLNEALKNETSRWTAFHFGTLSVDDFLRAERDLLADPETLLNYLDLKRRLDQQPAVPIGPSARLRSRFIQKIERHRRPVLLFAVGAALAASLALVLTFRSVVPPVTLAPATRPIQSPVLHLFDSSDELPASSSVL